MTEIKKKKGKRMVVKTVRLTPEAHQRISAVAGLLDITISDAVILTVDKAYPKVAEAAKELEDSREEAKRTLFKDE